jgi:hypothetical protein
VPQTYLPRRPTLPPWYKRPIEAGSRIATDKTLRNALVTSLCADPAACSTAATSLIGLRRPRSRTEANSPASCPAGRWPNAAVVGSLGLDSRIRPITVLQSSSALSKRKCQALPRTTDEACDLEASIVRPQHTEHPRAVPYLKAVGQIRRCMLPFHGMPVARRRCFPGLQVIEGRPVMDEPGSLLQGDQSHEVTLDFETAALSN